MKTKITLLLLLVTTTFFAQLPILGWAKGIAEFSTSNANTDNVQQMSVDASGNVYTVGTFTGTADFNQSAAVYNLTALSKDAFVQKLDANGNFLWAFNIGSIFDDFGYSVTNDAAGNVYITGTYKYIVDFDPSTAVNNAPTSFLDQTFIAKYKIGRAHV